METPTWKRALRPLLTGVGLLGLAACSTTEEDPDRVMQDGTSTGGSTESPSTTSPVEESGPAESSTSGERPSTTDVDPTSGSTTASDPATGSASTETEGASTTGEADLGNAIHHFHENGGLLWGHVYVDSLVCVEYEDSLWVAFALLEDGGEGDYTFECSTSHARGCYEAVRYAGTTPVALNSAVDWVRIDILDQGDVPRIEGAISIEGEVTDFSSWTQCEI